jgi:hypothetical protein
MLEILTGHGGAVIERQYCPELAVAMRLIDQPDLLLEFASSWNVKRKSVPRKDRVS